MILPLKNRYLRLLSNLTHNLRDQTDCRSASTPTLDTFIWRCSLNDNNHSNRIKDKISNVATKKAATYDNAYHERRRLKVTEGLKNFNYSYFQ